MLGKMSPEGMFDAFSPIESLRWPSTSCACGTTVDVDVKISSCDASPGKRRGNLWDSVVSKQ